MGVDGSWSAYYKSLPDLVAHTDVVAVGAFTKRGPSEVVDGTDATDILSPLKTTYEFKIDRVLRSTKRLAPDELIAVTQTGGIDDGRKVIQESDDDPLFSVGEHALLFLNEYAPGKYNVSGGPTGRFKIESGRVSAVVSDGVDIHDMPLDTLATNLR